MRVSLCSENFYKDIEIDIKTRFNISYCKTEKSFVLNNNEKFHDKKKVEFGKITIR